MAMNQNLVNTYDEMLGRGQDKRGEALVKGSLGVLQQAAKQEMETKIAQKKEHGELQEKMIGLENLGQLSAAEKQVTKSWLRGQRDEYNRLIGKYVNDKNPETKDEMDAILSSIANADKQIKLYKEDTGEFWNPENKIAVGSKSFDYDFYKNTYGGNSTINYDEGGYMGFGGGKSIEEDPNNIGHDKDGKVIGGRITSPTMLDDVYGKWNVEDSIVSTYARDTFSNLEKNKYEGKFFSKSKTTSDFYDKLIGIGPEGVQVFAEKDMTETYGETNLSFVERWKQGDMKDKSMYSKFKADGGIDWMFDDANSDHLARLMANDFGNMADEEYTSLPSAPVDVKTLQGSAEERDKTRKLLQMHDEFESVSSPEDHIEYFKRIGMKSNPSDASKTPYEFSFETIDGVKGWYVTDVDGPESQKQGVFVYKKVLLSTDSMPDLDVFLRFVEMGNIILKNNVMSTPK